MDTSNTFKVIVYFELQPALKVDAAGDNETVAAEITKSIVVSGKW